MCCVNWNRRYLQDLSALANHQDFTDRCNIAELHLSFNFIPELSPGTLKGFDGLTVLSLTCNCLVCIPSELRCVPTIQELHLSNNQIRVVENLETLVQLKILNLRCNRIRCIGNLKSNVLLERLTLSNNDIVEVNWEELPELRHLTFLGLYNNQLQFADVLKLVAMAPLLKEAFLGGNPFSNSLPLTTASAMMCINGHLDKIEAGRFVSLMRKRLKAAHTGTDEVFSLEIFASLFPGQTKSQALQRLLSVLTQLEHITRLSPALLKVDGERVIP